MTRSRKMKQRLRTSTIIALMIAGLLIPTSGAWAFFGGFSGIVFDPTNFAENVRQAVALLGQIERAATQIRLQQHTLAHLPVSVADSLRLSGDQLLQSLGHEDAEENPFGTFGDSYVQSLYPLDVPGNITGWLDVVRPIWTQVEREALIRDRYVAANVQQQMSIARERVLVQSSNGVGLRVSDRPGQVAALQAQQELLAHSTGEADKLLALRTLQAKRRAAQRARNQAERSHQRARRNALMGDWGITAETTVASVPNPFGRS